MQKAGKRPISFLLILCCLMQMVISPVSAETTVEEAEGAAVQYGSFAIDGISIDYESTLHALDDGRYYPPVTVLSTPIEMELNTHVRTAESGWYLVELWGANGADENKRTRFDMGPDAYGHMAESGACRTPKIGWYLVELWGANGADENKRTSLRKRLRLKRRQKQVAMTEG